MVFRECVRGAEGVAIKEGFAEGFDDDFGKITTTGLSEAEVAAKILHGGVGADPVSDHARCLVWIAVLIATHSWGWSFIGWVLTGRRIDEA